MGPYPDRRQPDRGYELKPFSKLDEATVSYFTEVRTHLKGVEDPEERSLLASNALAEIKGKEVTAATDPVGSRVLEVLLPVSTAEAVLDFAQAVLTKHGVLEIANSPCGSRVAEKLFDCLAAVVEESGSDPQHAAYQILQAISGALSARLYELITDSSGSHVVRRLLTVAAGFDVTPDKAPINGADAAGVHDTGKDAVGKRKGLAAKVVSVSGQQTAGPWLPELLEPIAATLCSNDYASSLVEELPYHTYASPFLQAYLVAQRGNSEHLSVLIPRILGLTDEAAAVDGLAGLAVAVVHGMMQERTSSHLMEVLFTVAPTQLQAEMKQRFLWGHLASLAMHPVANFVLQAALATVNKTPEMKAVKELRGSFPELLRSRRGGVIAATLAAAARTGAGQVDLCKALSAALRELPGNTQGPVAALLTLNTMSKLEAGDLTKSLSPLGCSMLASVYKFNKEALGEWVESLLGLSPKVLARVAADGGGSRVLEAFLEGTAAGKTKKRLFRKLQGNYGAIALTLGGNHFVEKCYLFANVAQREVIAEELSRVEAQLAALPRGQKLLTRCNVAELKRDATTWRRRTRTTAALRQEFAELLADDAEAQPQPATDTEAEAEAAAEQLPVEERAKRKQAGAEPPAEAAAEQPPAKKRTKRKNVSTLTEAEAQQLPVEKRTQNRMNKEDPPAEAEAAAEQPPAKKRRKRKQAGAEPRAEAAAEQPPAKERAKRKHLSSQTEAEAAAQQLPVQKRTKKGMKRKDQLAEVEAAAEQPPAKKRKTRKQAEGEVGADIVAEQLPVREGRGNNSDKEAARAAPDEATEQQPTKKRKVKKKLAQAEDVPETAGGQPAAEPPVDEPPAATQRLRKKQKAQLAGEPAARATDNGSGGVLKTAEVQKLSGAGPMNPRQIIAASTQNGVLTSLEVFEDRTKPSKGAKKAWKKRIMREANGA